MDGTILVWDPKTGKPLVQIPERGWVRSCAFSSDGRSLIYSTTGENLTFADASTGKVLHTVKLTDPDRPNTSQSGLDMHLSGDGKTLVSLSVYQSKSPGPRERGLLVTGWGPSTRKQLFRRSRADSRMWPVVSPDGKILALLSGEERDLKEDLEQTRIRIEDLASGKHLLTLPEAGRWSRPITFSADSRLVATVSRSESSESYELRLWEMASGREVLTLRSAIDPRAVVLP